MSNWIDPTFDAAQLEPWKAIDVTETDTPIYDALEAEIAAQKRQEAAEQLFGDMVTMVIPEPSYQEESGTDRPMIYEGEVVGEYPEGIL